MIIFLWNEVTIKKVITYSRGIRRFALLFGLLIGCEEKLFLPFEGNIPLINDFLNLPITDRPFIHIGGCPAKVFTLLIL